MFKTAAITLFAFFLSACVPIPQEPFQAVCREGFVVMRAGQSAHDPIVSDLPGHVDIVGTTYLSAQKYEACADRHLHFGIPYPEVRSARWLVAGRCGAGC